MTFTDPIPFLEAIRIAQERGLLPTNLSSAQIAQWDDELKRLSVFSARTNHAGYLQGVKDTTESLLQGEFNEATARAKLQDLADSLGYNPQRGGFPGLEDPNIPPAEPGSLLDLSSDKRTQLVLRTQMRQMANRGYREQGTTPSALFTFPCWELIRIYPRTVPRGSADSKTQGWPERWNEAGGTFYGATERMIAPKDDPVWAALGSRDLFPDAIGTDYPPFAFNSGMGWRQVSRGICKDLGVPFKDKPKPKPAPPLDDAQISVKGLDREFLQKLRDELDLEIREGVARLTAAAKASEAAAATSLGTPVSGAAQILAKNSTLAASMADTLNVIDRLHGDGPLRSISFTDKMPPGDYNAVYQSNLSDAFSIGVDPKLSAGFYESALTHEVGHWLDHIGIPSATKFASQGAPELAAWRQTVQASDAFRKLAAVFPPDNYWLWWKELWARSYAQFVAEESGNAAMASQLQKLRAIRPELDGIQWDSADFTPIREAMRELFRQLGWMR